MGRVGALLRTACWVVTLGLALPWTGAAESRHLWPLADRVPVAPTGLADCPDADGDDFAVCDVACQVPEGKLCGDCDDTEATIHPGAAETCNNADDDCNGRTDEGNPDGGAECTTAEQGLCAKGTETCVSGNLECVRDQGPSPEVCTGGLDEDCDGDVDGADLDCVPDCPDADGDDYAVCGAGCQLPSGKTCGDCDDTRPGVHPGATEACNDRDDDCNGQTDEGNPEGGASCSTGQQGVCAAGTQTCVSGDIACVRDQGPSAEVCTGGLDEDCDGDVDGADLDCVPDCPDADGDDYAVCGAGCQLPSGKTCGDCDDARPGVHPGATEACNDRDDDCDGQTDEGNPGGGDACSTGQQGVCAAGTETCVGGNRVCVRDQGPTSEVCTGGLDEDCDGEVDGADLDCVPDCPDADGDDYAVCGAGCQLPSGKTCGDCDDTRPGVHPGATEACNDRDDDCDGQTDEGNPGGGDACSTGQQGVCAAGTETCVAGNRVCVRDQGPSAEVCTGGLDEDCDGDVDGADLDCVPDCPDADGDDYAVCGAGCQLPSGKTCGDCDDTRPGVHPGATESCNDRDDDCDGQSDEGNPGGGASCNTGQQGVCAAGTQTCVDGALACVRNQAPSAEVCTGGLDEDCDGAVDAADTNCTPLCADGDADGYVTCAGCQAGPGKQCGDCDNTRSTVYPGAPEACNDRDDDCDGQTDEGNPGGGAACSTGQQGVCAAGTQTCVNGALACVRNQAPSAEVCTGGLDEDCDGAVDAADTNCTPLCADGDADGYVTCSGCQAGPGKTCGDCDNTRSTVYPGAPEACNDRDDDCDGQTDEGNPGGGAACSTGQQGVCAAGTQTCVDGALACVRNQAPSAEVCTGGLDEDCDGAVDAADTNCTPLCADGDADGYVTCAGCQAGPGKQCGDCDDTRPGVHPGATEACNDRDDDCDGQTDEGNPGGGASCNTGQQGVCAAGTQTCVDGALACVRNQAPSAEVCTGGLDEDCDGAVDAADTNCTPLCADGDADGYVTCAGCQAGPGKQCGDCDDTRPGVHPGATEACNDRDDDCDGQTDEGNPGGGASCNTGQQGVCAAGTQTCVDGALACVRNQAPSAEVCTGGLDEDCDGAVDAADTNCTPLCTDGDADGYVTCSGCQAGPGKTCGDCDDTRSTVYPGAPEACNDRDDDCDGQTDEGNPGGGAACNTGQQGVCAAGTQTCVDGALACVRNQAPSAEVCTGGLDEDCDGAVDAADTNCTPLCADGDADGYVTCAGCQADPGKQCGDCDNTRPGVHPGATESCNDRDDDCDGQTDEGNPGGGAACSTGQQGVCAAGTQTCVDGALACVRNQAPSAEVCTGGLDEDCDGAVDAVDTNCTPLCTDGDADGYVTCSGCQAGPGKTCGDCDDTRPGVHPGAPEACNGRDDDCDGQTDEGNPGGGLSCTTGQDGVCAAGTQTCVGGDLSCVRNQAPSAEVCTGGLDEDCDGAVDAADTNCTPLCADGDADGYVTCAGCQAGPGKTCGDCDNTRSTVYPGAPEACNDRDDDCDGQTDEGNPGGGAACSTGQQGVCGAGTQTCVDGALACVRNQAPSSEVCTGGLDEDCDGEVDAADTNCTPNCADADGDHFAVCGPGCQPPAGTTCGDCDDTRPGVHPGVTETCNGRDDDCDGQTDEGNPGGGAACTTGQQGVCGAGTRTCVTGALACVRNQAPSAEVCTGGLDEDCDGQGDQTDPDCLPDCVDQDDDGYVVCGSGCQVPQGKTCGECDDARPEVHPGATEVCNNRDDDCDGQNNEGNPGSGEACLTGQLGLCSAGTLACLGTGLVCQPSVTPVPELCSGGLDEDCDGFTDAADSDCTPLCPDADNDLYAVCSAACRLPGGRQCGDCDDGRQAVHPGALESCNNRDDDCDSQTDEGDPGGGFQCSTGEDGACDVGTRHCRSGQLVCERNGDPQPEACTNGEDDDCDGTQDAADPDCFPFCPDQDTDGYAICAVTCRLASGDQCGDCDDTRSSVNPGRAELCNGRDDDCDTQTDEGDPGGGGACSTGEDGICAAGTRHCTASGLSCLRNVGPLPENCQNGLDDDCDGEADDGDPNCAPICVDHDGDDFFACVSGCQVPQGATCGDCDDDRRSVHPGATEICNGRDDDCQGGSDEENPGGNATCQTGDPGNCAAGRTSCQHGDLICVALHAPGPEVCGNAVDEDCDGQSDAQDQDCVPFCADGDGDGFALCGAGCRLALGDACGECNDASPNVHPGVAERCNGVDDDCDAQTDEGDPGGGPACETGELGMCVEGYLVCREGALACDPTVSPSTEVCASGGDEDCDGFTNTRDPDCIAACQGVQGIDVDLDGVPNCADNCPQTPNRPQDDFDGDATGDACETGAVAADIDRSGRVDGLDLARLARAFGHQCGETSYAPASDFDHNCICDGDDLARMAAVFGRNP